MGRKKSESLSDGMRRLVMTCGQSRYAIWRETGISEATLSRFVSGEGMSFPNLDKLAAYLNWEVRQAEPQGGE